MANAFGHKPKEMGHIPHTETVTQNKQGGGVAREGVGNGGGGGEGERVCSLSICLYMVSSNHQRPNQVVLLRDRNVLPMGPTTSLGTLAGTAIDASDGHLIAMGASVRRQTDINNFDLKMNHAPGFLHSSLLARTSMMMLIPHLGR